MDSHTKWSGAENDGGKNYTFLQLNIGNWCMFADIDKLITSNNLYSAMNIH